jgi:histidine kinase/DNA gyrase B/HSP90-like ATPase
MTVQTINLEPDPRILVAITHNPMRPIDALCELIDNSIDAFSEADRLGIPIDQPTITVSLPRAAEIDRIEGSIGVLDNGPGLTLDDARNALRAGFTSNNPFDRLGLFGMGFNISTGKLGRRTEFMTARRESKEAIHVVIDLEEMVRAGSYNVPVQTRPKDPPSFSGTLVRVSEWWRAGSQNQGFAGKLVRLGVKSIAEELGRRYATILRERKIRIFVNDELCEPFEHCVWAEHRTVSHRELGKIPAVIRFDKVLSTQVRCSQDYSLAQNGQCPKCGRSDTLRTIEERVRGWVGIQRFDDANNYGIDLIRNGRVIRKWEKEAFFSWTDARGRQVKDYPIDSPYGRIAGEVHLDYAPTDFLKQDFQRTSPEWIRAIAFLRGESSLQPKLAKEANEPENSSPVFRLYQGYRRVRDFGTRDMYMGYWVPGEDRPRRIPREKEREYYERFLRREPGYYDDTEWWKLVEEADARPSTDLKECPECGFQTFVGAEECSDCGHIYIGKICLNKECGKQIARSVVVCPHCSTPQEVRPQDRWRCSFCGRDNPPTARACLNCGKAVGEVNPLSYAFLLENSDQDDELSIEAFSIPLPGGAPFASFRVDVYTVKPGVTLARDGLALPVVSFRETGLKIFIDRLHPLYSEYQEHPEHVVAMEVARYLQDANARFMVGETGHFWSIPVLSWMIARTYWKDRISVDPESTRKRAEDFFDHLREALPTLLAGRAQEIYGSMLPAQQAQLAQKIVLNGFDARELPTLIASGKFLAYLENRIIVGLVEKYPDRFFDNQFWSDSYQQVPIENDEAASQVRSIILGRYRNLLDDVLGFLESSKHMDLGYTIRLEHTLQLLTRRVVS